MILMQEITIFKLNYLSEDLYIYLIKLLIMSKYAKLIILGTFVMMACGPYLPFHEFYSLFYNDVASPDKNKIYNYYSNNYYDYNDYYNWEELKEGEDSVLVAMNYEWEKYTKGKIKALVFEETFSDRGKHSALVNQLVKSGRKESGEYLTLLWESKLYINDLMDYYNSNDKSDSKLSLIEIYNKCVNNISVTKDKFLIERYLYLISKIELQVEGLNELIGLYEMNQSKLDKNSAIYPKLVNNYAGCLYRSDRKAESFYHYAQLFYQYPILRENTFKSIKAYEIPFTKEVEKYCKTNDELANVYAMAAIQPKIDGLPFIEQIYAKNPNHELIELIFNREINKMEQMYFSSFKKKFEYWGHVDLNDKGGKEQLKRLQNLCNKVIDEKKINLTFWYLSNSYFHFLNDSVELARSSLLLAQPTNKVSKEQIERLRLMIDLADNKITSDTDISNLISKFAELRKVNRMEDASLLNHCGLLLKKKLKLYETYIPKESKSIFSGCNDQRLKKVEFTKNQKARLFAVDLLTSFSKDTMTYAYGLFVNARQILYDTTTIDFLLAFENIFINSYSMNRFDKNLLSAIQFDNDGFYTALGRKFVLNRDFEKAASSFSKISKESLSYVNTNYKLSYTDSLLDYVMPEKDLIEYCKKVEKMKKLAESGQELAIFEYAMHLYNLSYHGKSWILSKSYRSSYEPKEYGDHPTGWTDNYMPGKYYNLTDITQFLNQHPVRDKEINAKLDYLKICISKIHASMKYKNQIDSFFRINPGYGYDTKEKLDKIEKESNEDYVSTMKIYFNNYITVHRNTSYGKRVLKECSTASYYIEIE